MGKRISILIIEFLLAICIFGFNNSYGFEFDYSDNHYIFDSMPNDYDTSIYTNYLIYADSLSTSYAFVAVPSDATVFYDNGRLRFLKGASHQDYIGYSSLFNFNGWSLAGVVDNDFDDFRIRGFSDTNHSRSQKFVIYSTFDINVYGSSDIWFKGQNTEFSFPAIIPTTSSDVAYIKIIETQELTGMDTDLYEIRYCFNNGSWKSMFHNTTNDIWFTSVTKNGFYKFRYCYKGTDDIVEGTTTSSLEITNIVTSGSEFSDDVVKPILTTEYGGSSDGSSKYVNIRTQYFTYDEIKNLTFYYMDDTNFVEDDVTLWSTNPYWSTDINGTTYYYFHYLMLYSGTFYCCFYDKSNGKFSQISSSEIDVVKYYEDYQASKKDPPTLLEHILKALNSLNPFSSEFLGYKLINLFGDLLRGLFVPSDNFFSDSVDNLKSEISQKMPYSDYLKIFGSIENVSADDNSISINMPEYKISDNLTIKQDKFIDFSFVTKYREVWYSWVRGFVLIFLVIYNLNQISKLLRGVNISDAATAVGMQQPSNSQISGQISLFGGRKR